VRPGPLSRALAAAGPPLAVLVVAVVGLELAVRLLHVRRFLLPPPSDVFSTIVREGAELWPAAGETALAAVVGFAASAIVGVAAAVLLSSARWVQRAFYPYAVFFQTVPIIAIAPLLVVWIGYGLRTVAVSAFIVSVFPVVASTLAGLLSTESALRDLFRLYGAGRLDTMLKLRLPSALPSILTGLRVAAGLAVIGAIVGEFIAATEGVGYFIRLSAGIFRTADVFVGIIVLMLMVIIMDKAAGTVERRVLRWQKQSEHLGVQG